MKKTVAFLMVFSILTLCLQSCAFPWDVRNCPISRPNTKWMSSDGLIWFYVYEEGREADCKFVKDGVTEDVCIYITYTVMSFIMESANAFEHNESISKDDIYIEGSARFYRYRMEVTVESSTVDEYEKGDTIIFARFDKW